jgi:hypothetical protein
MRTEGQLCLLRHESVTKGAEFKIYGGGRRDLAIFRPIPLCTLHTRYALHSTFQVLYMLQLLFYGLCFVCGLCIIGRQLLDHTAPLCTVQQEPKVQVRHRRQENAWKNSTTLHANSENKEGSIPYQNSLGRSQPIGTGRTHRAKPTYLGT